MSTAPLRRSARTPIQRTNPNVANITGSAMPDGKKRKSSSTSKADKESMKPPKPPSTPRKRSKIDDASTATQATPPAVKLMTSTSYSTGDIDDATPPPEARGQVNRPAQPHLTNALLSTPRGSRVGVNMQVPSTSENIHQAADADTGLETTTENLLETAEAHLIKVDPRLKAVIEQHHCHVFSSQGLDEVIDPFRSLVSGIMAQQVSGAATKAIKNRFIGLFNEGNSGAHVFPSPQQVAQTDLARLRLAGLSQRKAEYIQGLAGKFTSGELSAQMLANASDEEVLNKLVAVRGLGVWSVEMFMCFGLKRMDILSTGDLGVQRGMAAYLGRDVAKLKAKGGKWKYITEKEMLDVSAKFTPYRSLFMWLMWRIEDVDIDAVQDAA
ncbi:MAG: hypothetical protein Q9159_007182 [Coniocarpon cinnabarinum]